jgi:hypothetical protein
MIYKAIAWGAAIFSTLTWFSIMGWVLGGGNSLKNISFLTRHSNLVPYLFSWFLIIFSFISIGRGKPSRAIKMAIAALILNFLLGPIFM